MISFKSTKVPMTSKIYVEDYIKALPPKEFKSFANKPVKDCLEELRRTDNNTGIIWAFKDRCFYIFGNNKGQDDYIFHELRKLDPNVSYVKDIEK